MLDKVDRHSKPGQKGDSRSDFSFDLFFRRRTNSLGSITIENGAEFFGVAPILDRNPYQPELNGVFG